MNPHLQNIWTVVQQDDRLSEEQKNTVFTSLKAADKEMEIIAFKLDRTEKVKRTTAILLEETIEELEQKRKAVEESNDALKKSLDELKAAQAQLIHAEKMASLGELTAGIAHEIQNPLNFVNNFSEVSIEMIDELAQESAVGSRQSGMEILDDIRQNLDKILHHGKRADAIVKGMLQHSRTSTGQKEPTDINALADEYLRLAYHGLRAKDKSFNADFRLEADESLPKINVIPQDIGRVLLNLINNAFYAVSARALASADVSNKNLSGSENLTAFKPTVTVTTKNIPPLRGDTGGPGVIEIRVKDNGDGIPAEIKDKIFQPFFTTKPTGEGTGLGLSMSYDIITKGHGGSLSVESSNGEGSIFKIILPLEVIESITPIE